MVKAIIDMTETANQVLQDEDTENINPDFWDSAIDLFLEKKRVDIASKSKNEII